MGQAASTTDRGNLTFAYAMTGRRQSSKVSGSDEHERGRDLLLSKPHLYALPAVDTASNAATKSKSRDSGSTADRDWQVQLAKDVSYIDGSYYHPTARDTDACPWESESVRVRTRRLSCCDVYRCMDRSMQHVDLCNRRLVSITLNIACFSSIKRLDLSHNDLSQLPDEIEALAHLRYFNVSHNRLVALPETICNLPRLVELDVSYNRLQDLTPCFLRRGNKSLEILHAHNNCIASISALIIHLPRLATLNLSENPVRILPAEIARLVHLRRLLLRGCPLMDPDASKTQAYPLAHDPPSLLEYCARIVARQQIPHYDIPSHLQTYFARAKACSSCRGPYFDSYVSRTQMIERLDGALPLEHRLCSAHWSDESDRVLAMFAASQQPAQPPRRSNSSRGHREVPSSPSALVDTRPRTTPRNPPPHTTWSSIIPRQKSNHHRWRTSLSLTPPAAT